ncbi:MAG: type IV pilus twitching motility protein PilT [Armatimonadetes bacterium]|nr:type IV pilus twitching motility protein PilT [Armatimonadota bacterium]
MTLAQNTFNLDKLLALMVEKKASDLHLVVGLPPNMRIDGELISLEEFGDLTNEFLANILFPILNEDQNKKFEHNKELDFSYSVPGLMLYQRNTIGAVIRAIPARPLTLEELNMPPIIKELCNRPRGLILVTGPTGSGKSTTLAAMIDYINSNKRVHIITIEDPIEFLHKSKKSVIRQRELGSDTLSFSGALKHVLRQDPDIILVGEMRDLETISLAVTAAETGHLVFGTLHTTSASSTIDRIVDVFPPHQQQQIRMQVSTTLEAVLTQTLIPKKDGNGRVCAMEIMVGTNGVRNLIREGKTHQLINMILSGSAVGMQYLDSVLKKLCNEGLISVEDALAKTSSPDELKLLLGIT